VYGRSGEAIFDTIKSANPDITDPNKIHAGQEILLPASGMQPAEAGRHYWISIRTSRQLAQIYKLITGDRAAGLRLVSFWSPQQGMQHAAAAAGPFASMQKARQTIASLPPELSSRAEILDLSGEGLHILAGKNPRS